MRRVRALVLAVLATAWGAPAGAQELRGALDAMKRGQWEAALRDLVPLAEADNADAQYALGTLYANGDGVPADLARAERLWRQAAAKGHAKAREQLAFIRAVAETAPAGSVAATGGEAWRVQLATVSTPESAQREFRRLARQYGEILAGTDLLAPLFTLPDGGQVVRVQAGPLSEGRARDICAKLRDMNAGCRVIRPEG